MTDQIPTPGPPPSAGPDADFRVKYDDGRQGIIYRRNNARRFFGETVLPDIRWLKTVISHVEIPFFIEAEPPKPKQPPPGWSAEPFDDLNWTWKKNETKPRNRPITYHSLHRNPDQIKYHWYAPCLPPSGESERNQLRESLADYAHTAWSGWMKHLFSLCSTTDEDDLVIHVSDVEHWTRQINTDYSNLSVSEKDSDRAEADKMLALMPNGEADTSEQEAILAMQSGYGKLEDARSRLARELFELRKPQAEKVEACETDIGSLFSFMDCTHAAGPYISRSRVLNIINHHFGESEGGDG